MDDDGLAEFEKSLAADKAAREREERGRDRRRKERDGDGGKRRREHSRDGGRHKRSRHSNADDEHRSSKHRSSENRSSEHRHREHKEHRSHGDREHRSSRHRSSRDEASESRSSRDAQAPGDKDTEMKAPQRDSWMTAPSALDIDYVQRQKKERTPPPKKEPERVLHKRELNMGLNDTPAKDEASDQPREISVDYEFGDDGSAWRMTKLKAVLTTADRDGRSVEDVALERYGSLQEYDIAREEQEELDRRRLYGKGYSIKSGPTGSLYTERLAKEGKDDRRGGKESQPGTAGLNTTEEQTDVGTVVDEARQAPAATMDQTALNRLRAQMMKAKLRRDPDAARLEEEYQKASAVFAETGPKTVALGAMENRMLAGTRAEAKQVETKRGRERGNLEENDDMTVEQMVQEEKRTKGQGGGDGMRMAERIAKDAKFDDDLEYMDENASKLAKRVHKSEVNLKNLAINEFQKVNRILDACPLCYHDDTGKAPIAPVISLGTRAYLTLPTEPEVSDGGAVIVPLAHHKNLLSCDDDEWEEIRNFMKSLTRMYHEQGREVVFYENAAAPHRHPHAAMTAVPIPYEEGETIPAYFKEAFLTSDEEWSQHKKVIDTGARAREGLGRAAFRRSIAKEAPYFHVWFSLDGGLGHVVEDSGRWPKGDLFAREVIGGVLDVGPEVIKKQGRWRKGDGRVEGFKKRWRKFDWTRVLEGE